MITGRIRRLAVLAVAGVCALAATSCSSSTNDAATISYKDATGEHTEHITSATLLDQVDTLQSIPAFRDVLKSSSLGGGVAGVSTNSALTATWLTQLIRQSVVDGEFNQQKLKVSDADRTAAQQSVQQNYGADVYAKLPKRLQTQLVDDQARLYAVLSSCASGKLVEHILVHTEAEATDLYNQIKQGADFGALAKAKSIDTGSAQLNGVLGCLAPNEFVPAFQSVAEKLPVNALSTPVKTQFGYHLILTRPWDPQFASNQQIGQQSQQAAAALLNARLKDLEVKVNPRFGTWGLTQSQSGADYAVTPPAQPTPRTARDQKPTTTTTLAPAATAPPGG